MFVVILFTACDRDSFTGSNTLLNIINSDVAVRITNSYEIFLFLSKGAARDTVVSLDVQLWEVRVFQGVEAEETLFQLLIIDAADVVFTIPNSYKVLIC